MSKDKIFNRWNPRNPMILLHDGSRKLYSALTSQDRVFVRTFINSRYFAGKIVEMRKDQAMDMWFYKVKTKKHEDWIKPSDFKNPI